ncbi:MAG: GumC family protein [Vicinamibacterales bacterium]
MSRVTDAMRRAGQHHDEQPEIRTDDMPFANGDDAVGTEDAVQHIASARTATVATAAGVDPVLSLSPEAIAVQSAQTVRLQARAEPTGDVQVQEIVRVLFRRSRMICAIVVLAVAGAAVYNFMATPIYQARARVVVEPEAGQVVPFRSVGDDPSRDDYFVTQLEVLRSRALAQTTLERLQRLPKEPSLQAPAIDLFQAGLLVGPTQSVAGLSRVVDITYWSINPQVAARMANGLAQTYVDRNLEVRKSSSREATDWLNQRLTALRQEVNSTEGALQEYREQKDGVSLESGQNIVAQKLAQLNASYTSARAERVQKEALHRQLTAMEKSGAPLDTFPAIVGNTFIQGLKADLAGLQRERLRLSEGLGDLHPDMIKINAAIDTAQHRLTAEMAKVVEGIKNDYEGAKAGEQALASVMDAQKREVLAENKKAIPYRALTRDAASTQQMFDTLQQRVKETEVSGELQSNNIRILDLAEVPEFPVWPRKSLNLAAALFGGTFIAIVLVLGMQYLSPKIVEPEQIAQALGLPLIGVAPLVSKPGDALDDLTNVPVPFQEAVRSIRTHIFLSSSTASTRTLAITSTNPGEGKTVIAGSLALAIAKTGRRVLLVDADMRRPQLDRLFNVGRSPGLSDIMTGEVTPSEALIQSSVKGLFILPAGAAVSSPSDLLDPERFNHLIQSFRQVFDLVVIDCPPVMVVADAAIVASAVMSVLFVVGAGTTSPEVARGAVDRLMAVHARIIGVVLNKTELDTRSEYYYGDYAAGERTA